MKSTAAWKAGGDAAAFRGKRRPALLRPPVTMHRWFPARTSLGRDDDWACGGSTALWIDGDQGERSAHHFYAALKTSAAPYLRLRRLRTYGSRLARLRRLAGMTMGLVAAEPALWIDPPPSL